MSPYTESCAGCGERLFEPGAAMFSPPDSEGRCTEYRACGVCWAGAISLFGRLNEKVSAPRMLAEAFASMRDEDQAQMFIEVARIAAEWPPAPHMIDQWYAVGRHLRDCECSTDDARELVRSLAAGAVSHA